MECQDLPNARRQNFVPTCQATQHDIYDGQPVIVPNVGSASHFAPPREQCEEIGFLFSRDGVDARKSTDKCATRHLIPSEFGRGGGRNGLGDHTSRQHVGEFHTEATPTHATPRSRLMDRTYVRSVSKPIMRACARCRILRRTLHLKRAHYVAMTCDQTGRWSHRAFQLLAAWNGIGFGGVSMCRWPRAEDCSLCDTD